MATHCTLSIPLPILHKPHTDEQLIRCIPDTVSQLTNCQQLVVARKESRMGLFACGGCKEKGSYLSRGVRGSLSVEDQTIMREVWID